VAPEQPRSQLEDLQAVTDAALSYLPLEKLLDELLTRVRDILSVDTAAILLVDDDRQTLVARAAKGLEEEVEAVVRVPMGRGFAGRVAAGRRPVHIPDVMTADVFNSLLREKGLRSLLGVPLVAEGEVVGVLHVGSLGDRDFTSEDTDLLQRAGDRAALAIHARISERERGLAEELQRSLLPQRLPSFPGMHVAARYAPAASALVGGDWYDSFVTRRGMLCLAIGDVVGRGFRAAAVMAQLRSGLRAYALDERSPLEVIERLNTLLRQLEPGRTATLVYIVLDPLSNTLEIVSAANAPPVLVSPEGEAELVELPPAPPLGASASSAYQVVTGEVLPGSRLMLYTDGLVERPGESLDVGLERLIAASSGSGGTLDAFCQGIFDSLLPGRTTDDDAALITIETEELSDPMHVELPAERDSAPLLRRLLSRWLTDRGASQVELDSLLLASAEACSNAIEHAYPPDLRTFEVDVASHDQDVTVIVRDSGTWRPPRGTNRGRGIKMMEALADSVEIIRSEQGTTVEIRHHLTEESLRAST
jgi:anti-sigma regulatory factor (Ser/Thr protein kinase)/putative methionine-R-sulfoxide reductase with GAF domain